MYVIKILTVTLNTAAVDFAIHFSIKVKLIFSFLSKLYSAKNVPLVVLIQVESKSMFKFGSKNI
ncbi:hypothetical protein M2373_000475 [Chryseobacterium sp. JUb7]|nr:hypothetical protein [Chryseobacterium sp. JUb7]